MQFIKAIAPSFMWGMIMLGTLMLLSVHDAETFLVSFVLMGIGMLGSVLLLPGTPMTFPRAPVPVLVVALWALAFLSTVLSQSSFTSYLFFCFLGMLPLSFFYACLAQQKETFFRSIYKVAIVVFVFLSLLSLVQYFYVPELLPNGLTKYPFGNPNSLAGYLSLGFFTVYGGFIAAEKPAHKYICFIVAALILAAICTTGSRGALLALLGGVVFMGFVLRYRVVRQKKRHFAFWGTFVAAFLALGFFAPAMNPQTPIDVVVSTVSGQTPVLWDRPFIWASTWEIIKDHFWTGTGVGTFSQVYPAYRDGDVGTAGHMVHNDVLQFWAEMGVLSPLLFVLLVGAAIYKTIKVLQYVPPEDPQRIKIVAPFCALGAMIIHTQISFHFYVLPTLFVAGTLLAYWFWQVEKIQPSKMLRITSGARAENLIVKLCLVVMLVGCVSMLSLFQFSEVVVDQARKKAKVGDMTSFSQLINLAGDLSFKRNARALALASTVPSRIVQINAAKMTPDHIFKTLMQAENLLERSLQNNPYLASTYHEQAIVAELAYKYVPQLYKAHYSGAPPSVRSLIEISFRKNPLHAGTRIKLAELMIRDGERDEAYALLKDGLKWRYTGSKGLKLFEKIAQQALARRDVQTQKAALGRIKEVYGRSRYLQDVQKTVINKVGPFWYLIKEH